MRERLGLFLLLAGTFLLARVVLSVAVSGHPPRAAVLLVQAAAIPAAQALLLPRRRPKEPTCASS